MKFPCLAFCLGTLSICFSTPSEDFLRDNRYLDPDIISETTTILLSEVHSGSTWCRYLIEYATKKPTMQIFHDRPGNLPLGLIYEDLGTDLDSPKIWKCHNAEYIDRLIQALGRELDPNLDKLVFILRDYRECLKKIYHTQEKIIELLDTNSFQYIDILQIYDRWNNENKLLILYEDLLVNPEKVLHQLAGFFRVPCETIPDFINNLEFHKDRAKTIFNSNFGESQSLEYQLPEISLVFHQSEFPSSFWKEVDFKIKTTHPYLWNKYLKPIFRDSLSYMD